MSEKKRRPVGNYARLLGTLHRNPKIQRLSNDAFRAYINALSWAADQLSDGKVPLSAVPAFMPGALPRARQSAIALLQKRDADGCALWYRTAPDEIEIHDYLEINASRAEIQAKSREQARRAKARWDSAASGAQPDSTVPEAMPAATPAARSRRESRVISPDAAGNAGSHASPSPLVPIDLKRSPPLVTARSAPAHARGTNGDALAQDEALTPELAARYAEAQQKLADARAARRQEGETNDLDPPRKRGPKLVPPGAGGADG